MWLIFVNHNFPWFVNTNFSTFGPAANQDMFKKPSIKTHFHNFTLFMKSTKISRSRKLLVYFFSLIIPVFWTILPHFLIYCFHFAVTMPFGCPARFGPDMRGSTFKGFMLQCRNQANEPVGRFSLIPGEYSSKFLKCGQRWCKKHDHVRVSVRISYTCCFLFKVVRHGSCLPKKVSHFSAVGLLQMSV